MSARNTFSQTCPGAVTAQTVADGIALHYKAHGSRPVGVTVNPKDLDAAVTALKTLGLPWPVEVNGGCTQGWIWMVKAK